MDVTQYHRLKSDLESQLGTSAVKDVRTDDELARDFGNLLYKSPYLLVTIDDETQLPSLLKRLHQDEWPYKLRACGHSSGGYSLVENGVLISFKNDSVVLDSVDRETVRLYAGQKWMDIEPHLNRQGKTFPVLTNHLQTSVVGTLSAGGYGIRSVKLGPQVDHVRQLQLILKDGTVQQLGPEEEKFRLALTGMGKAGIITSVDVVVEAYHPLVKIFAAKLPQLSDFATCFAQVTPAVFSTVDVFWGEFLAGELHIGAGILHDNPMEGLFSTLKEELGFPSDRTVKIEPFDALFNREQTTMPRSVQQSHCWSDFGIPSRGLAAFLLFLEEEILPRAASILNRVYLLPIAPKTTGPYFPFDLRIPGTDAMTFGVGVYFNMQEAAEKTLAKSLQQEMLKRAVALGARPYLTGFDEATAASLHPAYAAALEAYKLN